MVLGSWNRKFDHLPMAMAVSQRKKIDLEDWIWSSVLATNGQPKNLR